MSYPRNWPDLSRSLLLHILASIRWLPRNHASHTCAPAGNSRVSANRKYTARGKLRVSYSASTTTAFMNTYPAGVSIPCESSVVGLCQRTMPSAMALNSDVRRLIQPLLQSSQTEGTYESM